MVSVTAAALNSYPPLVYTLETWSYFRKANLTALPKLPCMFSNVSLYLIPQDSLRNVLFLSDTSFVFLQTCSCLKDVFQRLNLSVEVGNGVADPSATVNELE